jgi:hypothetical protein
VSIIQRTSIADSIEEVGDPEQVKTIAAKHPNNNENKTRGRNRWN